MTTQAYPLKFNANRTQVFCELRGEWVDIEDIPCAEVARLREQAAQRARESAAEVAAAILGKGGSSG